MSGPIVRSYGVPNWDEIFGEKSREKGSKKSPKKPKTAAKKKAAKAKTPAKKKPAKRR